MKVDYKKLLAFTAKNLGMGEGEYLIFLKDLNNRVITVSVDKDYNVTSEYINAETIFSLLTDEKTTFRKAVPAPEKYFYFDEKLHVLEKSDMGDELDKKNRDNMNYFPAKKYSRVDILKQFSEHILNMRFNLLANFSPSAMKGSC